jgi:3-deoxy-D-arabino-heptulosonate 7-phosphate (DAHP) synthase class II
MLTRVLCVVCRPSACGVQVFGLPPLPSSVKATRTRNMYLGSKPSGDHLKASIDAKMRFMQEVVDELFHFVSVRSPLFTRSPAGWPCLRACMRG